MVEIIKNLVCIAIIITFITDVAGFFDTTESIIKKKTKWKFFSYPYLLKCSLCQVFWAGLIYLLIIGSFDFEYIVIVCLLSGFTGVIQNGIMTIYGIINKALNLIAALLKL